MIITKPAQSKVSKLIGSTQKIMPDNNFFLRITAIEDNGIKYQTYFDYEKRTNDLIFNFEGFDLRIDEDSNKYLEAVTLNFDDKQGFVLDIPDA